MFRRAESPWVCVVAVLLVTLAAGGPASAQSKPTSDLLLPYFEVDLAAGGTTTLFAVSNSLDRQVDLVATLRTSWGIEVLSVPVKLKAKELWTVDLRNWLVEGDLPEDQDLTAAELAHLQAALTGQPSPSDGLYYAATSAHAVGSLTFRTQGSRPDALRGESFLVDPDQGASPGQPLADVDRVDTPNGGCLRQSVKHVSGSGFGRSRITLWMATAGTPQPASGPEDRSEKVTASVFSSAGKLLKRQQLRLLPVDKVTASSLGLTQALGRIVLVTETESVAGVQPAGRAVFTTSCANATPPAKPSIQLVTLVKNQDANTAPGPSIAVGDSFNWQYQVSNTGVGALTGIKVRDGDGDSVKCPKTILQQGESMTCRSKDVAVACQQQNTATATASSKKGTVSPSSDTAYYFGSDGSEISIELLTNGEEVEDEVGPSVEAGTVVSWSYLVTNSGTQRLYDIEVTDSQGVTVTCPEFSLASGAVMTCTAQAVATAGQYTNTGTATAATSCGTGTVSASATSYYLGVNGAGLGLVVELNGSDASTSPGLTLAVGTPLTWEYTVGNSGDLAVYDIALTDDQGNTASCVDTSVESGGSTVCLVHGVAAACQATIAATVSGETAQGDAVSATATTYYFGQEEAAVGIDVTTNGSDGPTVAIGAPVDWTYVVTNLGKVALSSVTVSDSQKVTVTCPQDDLRPGESMTCEASGVAVTGTYSNTGTVTADDPCGVAVTAQDSSSYVGEGDGSALALRNLVNGEEASTPPGATLTVGDAVAWSYVVTNAGQTTVTDVAVASVTTASGAPAGTAETVTCPKTSLLPAESMTCTASGVVQEGSYSNVATATATSLSGLALTATANSYYLGKAEEAEANRR